MIDEKTTRYADIFAALGAEPRLEIMRLLLAVFPQGLTVSDMQSQLQIPNSTLSHHLEKLRIEDLVASRRDKQFLWYSANVHTVEELLSFLYNGCAMSDRSALSSASNRPTIPEAEQIIEPSPTVSGPGLMFTDFLRSLEEFFSGLMSKLYMPKLFEGFTQKAIHSIFLAQKESFRLNHAYVGTEQLLIGLLKQETGIAGQVLTAAGVRIENVQREVEKIIGRGTGTHVEIPFTPRAKKTLELAVDFSNLLGHSYVGTEHLLYGILQDGEGLGARVLENLGFNLKTLEQQLRLAMKTSDRSTNDE
jgi:ATP-dependent Clp protease ATP-binding subunit ClpC